MYAASHERYYNSLMLRINSSSARPPTTDIVAAFCSLTAGIGLEKRWKPEGPQRSAVHYSAAQWTCLRQSLLQMQKLLRHRTHPEKTQSAPRTVNALLDLLQFLGPSSARFQAVIHSLSVRFMPKSSLRCLSKSGMWAAP